MRHDLIGFWLASFIAHCTVLSGTYAGSTFVPSDADVMSMCHRPQQIVTLLLESSLIASVV